MERDMDLCREILRQMAAHRNPDTDIENNVEGRSLEEINYNVYLLYDGGLIEAIDDRSLANQLAYKPLWMTWKGSDFYAAVKDDTIWRRGKERLVKFGGDAPFDVLLDFLKGLVRDGWGA
jgi:hypothetical protein